MTNEAYNPTEAQHRVVEILVDLIGLSGVHKRPEQGDHIVLDLLPASHVALGGEPFCVRVAPDGRMERISDLEAGIEKRPNPMEALMATFALTDPFRFNEQEKADPDAA